jgi:hypothetical protein
MLRVDHSVGIIEKPAVGMVGGILLVQRLRMIYNVVGIETKVSSMRAPTCCILRPIKKCQRKAGPTRRIRNVSRDMRVNLLVVSH